MSTQPVKKGTGIPKWLIFVFVGKIVLIAIVVLIVLRLQHLI